MILMLSNIICQILTLYILFISDSLDMLSKLLSYFIEILISVQIKHYKYIHYSLYGFFNILPKHSYLYAMSFI